ncbi:hypothetical protein D3C85_1393130 [compost metagenome]
MSSCVHTRHCCSTHGCKYMDEDCPVVLGIKEQECLCEDCDSEKNGVPEFFLVCAWSRCYPVGGIDDIKFVTTDSDAAEEYKMRLKDDVFSSYDYVEIYHSTDLHWG